MKIYVLVGRIEYCEGSVLGAYTSKALANEAKEEYETRPNSSNYYEAYELKHIRIDGKVNDSTDYLEL